MRTTLLLIVLALFAQERATLISPRPVDNTVRAYEVIGWTVNVLPTITAAKPGTAMASPRQWFLQFSIRYIDNVGMEYVDTHTETSNADKLIAEMFDGKTGTVRARLLQHLIDEKKIPPARITK